MKIKHPLHSATPDAISILGKTLAKGSPVSIPVGQVSKEIIAYEKAGVLRIVKRGNIAMLVKL